MIRRLVVALLLVSAAPAMAADVEVLCFTPGGECTDVVVNAIGSARRQVLVQAYSFTSPEIIKALADAKKRGVDVRAVLDKSNFCKAGNADCQNKGTVAADTLAISKVPVLVDRAHAIAHNKVMVIDGERVITGSFNFTRSAQERNAENLLVLRDRELARRYAENWQEHAGHSEPYLGTAH